MAVVLLNLDAYWFWPGLVVSLVGLLLQLWMFGSARGTGRLSINGPYVLVRNPLSLAGFLLYIGFILMTGIPWLLPVYAVLYGLWVVLCVRFEEAVLEEKEVDEYRKYIYHVPRFLPRLKPCPRGHLLYFKMKYFSRHHELERLLLFSGLCILCYVITHYPG